MKEKYFAEPLLPYYLLQGKNYNSYELDSCMTDDVGDALAVIYDKRNKQWTDDGELDCEIFMCGLDDDPDFDKKDSKSKLNQVLEYSGIKLNSDNELVADSADKIILALNICFWLIDQKQKEFRQRKD